MLALEGNTTMCLIQIMIHNLHLAVKNYENIEFSRGVGGGGGQEGGKEIFKGKSQPLFIL